MDSTARSGAEISGEAINKMGKYSFKALKNKKPKPAESRKVINYYICGNGITESVAKHKGSCPAKNAKCKKCVKTRHFVNVCKSTKKMNRVYTEGSKESEEKTYSTNYHRNIFRVKASSTKLVLQSCLNSKQDFKVQVVVHNSLQHVIADTGATISVCGTVQAKNWGLLGKICPSKKKTKPYNSPPLPVYGEARCSVTFGHIFVPVVWHIISGLHKPILDGNTALQLGIISFKSSPDAYQSILMIDTECRQDLQYVLQNYPQNFQGLGNLKNYQVKLHVDKVVKPIKSPPRSIPYHLHDRADKLIKRWSYKV